MKNHFIEMCIDARSLKIVPVGVGRVDPATRTVSHEGTTSFERLDIIGYALVDPDNQGILEDFSKGNINLNEMINRLSSGF